jgi:hypothetical protein
MLVAKLLLWLRGYSAGGIPSTMTTSDLLCFPIWQQSRRNLARKSREVCLNIEKTKYRRNEKCVQIWFGKHKGKRQLGRPKYR